jgi:sulfur-carrier protein
MKLELRFFASLREALETSGESIDLPSEITSVAQLRDFLIRRGGVWAQVMSKDKPIRCALNQQMVGDATLLEEGAEIAFFPPVTGG